MATPEARGRADRWAPWGLSALVLLAWLSAGTAPFEAALRGAQTPSDFATDYVPAARLWRGLPPGVDAAEGNREGEALGVLDYTPFGTPYRAHPPPSVLVVAALVPAGFPIASLLWAGLSLVAALVIAASCAEALAPAATRWRWTALGFVALALWPPTLHNLEKGQWSLLIGALLALGRSASARGAPRSAGGLVALAAAFKVVPGLALLALAPRGRSRAVVLSAALVSATVFALSLPSFGVAGWIDFVRAAPENTRGWQTGLANTVSLWGLLARLLIGGPYAHSMLEGTPIEALGPWLARGLWVLAVATLAARTVRAGTNDLRLGLPATPAAFAAWSSVIALVNPLGWTHTAVWLALPMALLFDPARTARDERDSSALLAAAVLLTLPRQALFEMAGPPPVSAAAGLVLAAHLVGAGLVLRVAWRAMRRDAASVAP